MAVDKTRMLSFDSIRDDFPILNREVHPGMRLTYLDSAATSQKPLPVIEAMNHYYQQTNANINRGIHVLAEEATYEYEAARGKIAAFIGAVKSREIIFTRNTTESINLLAYTLGRSRLKPGDLIVLTEMEHHSNLVPWQIIAEEYKLRLEFIKVTDDGILDQESYEQLLAQEPKIVSFTHVSNVLGTVNPAAAMIKKAKEAGAIAIIDAAQSIPHIPVNVQNLGADFVAFSAHKMLGPTGIGVLWGREELLEKIPPFLGGGDMIKKVYLRTFAPNDLPHKFEAGTPAIAEAIGFGAAIDYLNSIGMDRIAEHEKQLVSYAFEQLNSIKELKIIGPEPSKRSGVVSFTLDNIHPHDIAQILDGDGVAVRAGHHCAMPLHDRYGIPATTRASFYVYNTLQDIDVLVKSIKKTIEIFG